MTQTENTTFLRKGKHLNSDKRKKIEACKQLEHPLLNRGIAELLGHAAQMIHTEVKDGTVRQVQNGKTNEYKSFVGHKRIHASN